MKQHSVTLAGFAFCIGCACSALAADLGLTSATTPALPSSEAREGLRGVTFVALDLSHYQDSNRGGAAAAIRRILDLESRASTVSQAIQIKSSGLTYCQNLRDLLLLSRAPFPSPSSDYQLAQGEFVVQNVASKITPGDSIETLLALESLCTTVNGSMAVKEAGRRLAHDLAGFQRLCRPACSSPSDGYLNEISHFIAARVAQHAAGGSLSTLLALENECRTIDDALAVKRAGVSIAVGLADFDRLSQPASGTPSDAFADACISFMVANVSRFLTSPSDLPRLVRMECRCRTIGQAMALKRAGLAVTKCLRDFLVLTQPASPSPSAGYARALGDFIAEHSRQFGGSCPGPQNTGSSTGSPADLARN